MRITLDLIPSVEQLAESFCELDDDAQAKFFVECARIGAKWRSDLGTLGADWQWYKIGKHLANCECSSIEARDMVKAIAEGALSCE